MKFDIIELYILHGNICRAKFIFFQEYTTFMF